MKESQNRIDRNKKISIYSDLPCEDDQLEIEYYIKALKQFVEEAPTPFSISLQGEWGSGKTSIIKMLKNQILKDSSNSTIKYQLFFNAFYYGKFFQGKMLVFQFLNQILNTLSNNQNSEKKIINELKTEMKSFFTKLLKQTTLNFEIPALGAFTVGLNSQNDNLKDLNPEEILNFDIKKIYDEIQNGIEKIINDNYENKNKMIVYIDDLDRMDPVVAINFLEELKMFCDIKGIIYIISIDFDVIKTGVNRKYNYDFTREKASNFFEKYFQLYLRIPLEKYHIDNFLSSQCLNMIENEDEKNELIKFIDFIQLKNPRKVKKILNNIALHNKIKQEEIIINTQQYNKLKPTQIDSIDFLMLIISLIIEEYSTDLFLKLISMDGPDEITEFFSDNTPQTQEVVDNPNDEEKNQKKSDYNTLIQALKKFLNYEFCPQNQKKENEKQLRNERFYNNLQRSSITSKIIKPKQDHTVNESVQWIMRKFCNLVGEECSFDLNNPSNFGNETSRKFNIKDVIPGLEKNINLSPFKKIRLSSRKGQGIFLLNEEEDDNQIYFSGDSKGNLTFPCVINTKIVTKAKKSYDLEKIRESEKDFNELFNDIIISIKECINKMENNK